MVIVSLPPGRELGPVPGQRIVEPEGTLAGEPVHEHRGQRLAGGEEQERHARLDAEGPVEDDLAVAQHAQLRGRTRALHQLDHLTQLHAETD
jgi:hypothetical protein